MAYYRDLPMAGLFWLVALTAVSAQQQFCEQALPATAGATGHASFELVFVQAPLESEMITPYPAEILSAYHTALVLFSAGENWTIEYRAKNFLNAIFPHINISNSSKADEWSIFDWSSSHVGFCFTRGILHGQKHWTTWRSIARISGGQLYRLVDDFLHPWMIDNMWSYQLFEVVEKSGNVLMQDLTCGQGVLAALEFLNSTLGVQLLGGISHAGELPVTTVQLHVDSMEIAPSEDFDRILRYYEDASLYEARGIVKVIDVFKAFHDQKYIRLSTPDGEKYYHMALRLPYITINYGQRLDWRGSFPIVASASPVIVA